MSQALRRSKVVEANQDGLRLDKYLASWDEISTRSRGQQLIEEKRVSVNGKLAKSSLIVLSGDSVDIDFPESRPASLQPYNFALDVIFEDAHLLVVNKPSGLVVHPAAGHEQDTLVNALIAHTKDLSMGFGEMRPGIVHRLDRETSGLLVVAKNDHAHEILSQQFQDRSIHRIYQALCFGEMRAEKGICRSWLARHPTDRKKYASLIGDDRKILRDPEAKPEIGKWAVTQFRRLHTAHQMSFLQLKLETGRTHQIRVHLSEEGYPLVGDSIYGTDRRLKSIESTKIRQTVSGLQRFLLHARELGFIHPATGERLMFQVEWPTEDFAHLNEWGFLK